MFAKFGLLDVTLAVVCVTISMQRPGGHNIVT